MTKRNNLTQSELKELLHYDPSIGVFTWKVKRSNRPIGSVAGGVDTSNGYHYISVNNISYRTHRLAWLYVTGKWPQDQIDHKNRKRADNRFCNLKEATNMENHKNKMMTTRNSSGFNGVHKSGKKWSAEICANRKSIKLGLFITHYAACYARHYANIKYGFHPNHGKS